MPPSGPDGDLRERLERSLRALERNESRRREFMERFPAIAFETGPDRRTREIWGAVGDFVGGDFRALPGEPGWEMCIHPDDRARYHTGLAALWTNRDGMVEHEYRLAGNGRGVRWVSEQVWRATDDAGLPVIRGFIREVNTRGMAPSGADVGMFDLLRAEQALRESEARYRAVVEAQTDLIFRCFPDGTLSFVNDSFRIRLGFWMDVPDSGRTIRDLFGDGGGAIERAISTLDHEHLATTLELLIPGPERGGRWIQWTISAITDTDNRRIEYQAAGRDISMLKRIEERLRASLADKEALLGEVHHRVKNNLQIISSILDMSGMAAGDDRTAALIEDARSRIHTMALIHSQLMRGDRVDRIDMRQYAAELTGHLLALREEMRRRVTLDMEIGDVYLDMDRAVPFALALHEIISNALKHAFPGGRTGTIRIRVTERDGMVFAVVGDDGVGLPEGAFADQSGKFGVMLIQLIIREQLAGTLDIGGAQGAEYRIAFPIRAAEDKNAQNHGG